MISVGLKVGDVVDSVPVGRLPAFRGVIRFIGKNVVGEKYYHVRDDRGRSWHRTSREITRAPVETGAS